MCWLEDFRADTRLVNYLRMAAENIDFLKYREKANSEEYSQGLCQPAFTDDNSLFWECFCKWKRITPMPAEEEQWVIEKLEEWLKMRVDGIMLGNHRKYYGECATFIAALGEVRESRGEVNGKAKLMAAYKENYSRRTAFHKELRAFGMR